VLNSRKLREQIELGRRLMSWVGTVKDQANISAYVMELEAKLQQAGHEGDDGEDSVAGSMAPGALINASPSGSDGATSVSKSRYFLPISPGGASP
jgi:hypothetical protein